MASQKTAAPDTDEEIIDLTDIIEKGAVPASEEGNHLDSQMSDLYAKSDSAPQAANSDVDADIDALLSQMNSGEAPGSNASEGDGHVVNPNETLTMPGMGDVDALLGNLDIPPQPQAEAQDAFSAPRKNAEELDSLLDTMGDNSSVASDEETASLDDLDALFSRNAQPKAAAPAPASPAKSAPEAPKPADDFDLDALLGDAPAKQQPTAAAPIPEQPKTPAAPKDVLNDLDALLNQKTQPKAAAPAPTPPAQSAPE
ncbi:MAG: hypothetical protein K2O70_10620, partial [Desulfovibrionaceae bacterium]|nr:hypothetical protein [Desulfovibrionaceae bacterium]